MSSASAATSSQPLVGPWSQNVALVQLLGLCPLLAITSTLANAFILGCASLFVILLSGMTVSCTRHIIPHAMRLPIFVLIIGGWVCAIDLLMETWFYTAHKILGLFVPLIVTNCVILAHVETCASKNPLLLSINQALLTGSGFLITLSLLGGIREWLGHGTLLRDFDTLLGVPLDAVQLSTENYTGFIPALLPVGTFFICALLIFLHRLSTQRT